MSAPENKKNISAAETLMAQARKYLEDGEPAQALKIGKKLKSMRYSGAFEIIALAYSVQGKPQQAIKFRNYDLVAASVDEGLAYIREMEPSSIRDSIKVVEHERSAKQDWQNLKGIYAASAYFYFPEDEMS